MISLRKTSWIPTCGAKRSPTGLPGLYLLPRMDQVGKQEFSWAVGLHMPTKTTFQISTMKIFERLGDGVTSSGWTRFHRQICSTMQIHWKNYLTTKQYIATTIMFHRLFQDNQTNRKSLVWRNAHLSCRPKHGHYVWGVTEFSVQANHGGDARNQENYASSNAAASRNAQKHMVTSRES